MELAKLAALLDGKDHLCRNSPESALIVAARVYVKAVVLYDDLALMSEDHLIQHLMAIELPALPGWNIDHGLVELMNERTKEKGTKRLYPDTSGIDEASSEGHIINGLDSARIYLSEKSTTFGWKTFRMVDENILRFHKDRARKHNERHREDIESVERYVANKLEAHIKAYAEEHGKSVDDLSIDEHDEIRRTKTFPHALFHLKGERQTGQKLYDKFMAACAIMDWTKGETVYWRLSTTFLDQLLEWRIAMKKQPGGVKALDELS